MESTINTSRRLGVEIECVIPIIGTGTNQDVQDLLAQVLSNHGIPSIARPYSHNPIPPGCMLAVEHDSSLRPESKFQGLAWSKIEVKTAPMTWPELERVLPQALEIVNYCGGRINPSCGMHVHIGLPEVTRRPLFVRNLQHFWWRFHPILFHLVAPSRRHNTYCCAPQASEARQYDDCTTYAKLCQRLSRANRYCGLNLTNLSNPERLTVEWRIHQGTTDFGKIKAWALACERFVEYALQRNCHYKPDPIQNNRAGLEALLVTTGLKPNSRVFTPVEKDLRQAGRFLLKRWKHFNCAQDRKTEKVAA